MRLQGMKLFAALMWIFSLHMDLAFSCKTPCVLLCIYGVMPTDTMVSIFLDKSYLTTSCHVFQSMPALWTENIIPVTAQL